MNSVRLPSADPDKRAVQLDQFPSEMIDSVQVSKTFMPDQQGDASGGAVNVKLKGIPNEKVIKVKAGTSFNSQSGGKKNFLTYHGGGVNFWGNDDGSRDKPSDGNFGGAVGVSRGATPVKFNESLSAGAKKEINDLVTIGGFVSVYHKHDSSYQDNGIDDAYWVDRPGEAASPRYEQGTVSSGTYKTSLYNTTQGSIEVQRGGLISAGIELGQQSFDVIYMTTLVAEDSATLAEDRRGKEYYFPGYDPSDPNDPGNQSADAAPYIRTETLEYTERTTNTLQFQGDHKIPTPEFGLDGFFKVLSPEIDWTIAKSSSKLNVPDKRQFGSILYAEPLNLQLQYQPSQSFSLGNLQRVWKDVSEDSDQYFTNWKFPFEQWSGDKGYVKLGLFHDEVDRQYNQDSFSNFSDPINSYSGNIEEFWSEVFPSEGHVVTAADIDVDYVGKQEISAKYVMGEMPLSGFLKVLGGVRYEETDLSIVNDAEEDVIWVTPGNLEAALNPGDADVSFNQKDVLPALGITLTPVKVITLRGTYSQTVARQTFKELTPIQQQEYLGADIFVGNPELKMSDLKNYDMRLEYTPYEGGLLSYSYFYKRIRDPIEYVQRRTSSYGYTTAVNYPSGILSGSEFELRQELQRLSDSLEGLTVGGNMTFIKSKVTLPQTEMDLLSQVSINVPMSSRDMTNTPDYLYNVFVTYDWKRYGADFGVFYTVKGDTLIAGAGQSNGHFLPNVYEKKYGTLNLSMGKKFLENGKINLQVKNILNPAIQTVYRAYVIDGDTVKTSFKKGVEYSLSVNFTW